MKKQHQAEMDVLMKRIESKRREYTKQRNTDCDRLLQRNKNIQSTFDSKHVSIQFNIVLFARVLWINTISTCFFSCKRRQQNV